MGEGFLARLRQGLRKTSDGLGLTRLFGGRRIDEGLLEEMEERLLLSDMGPLCAAELVKRLREAAKKGELGDGGAARPWMRSELARLLDTSATLDPGQAKRAEGPRGQGGPKIWMFFGVNGVGKTTSLAKLAWRLSQLGSKVVIAAGDTYRAAAGEQLERWAERIGCRIVRHKEGGDPSAVLYDAYDAAASRGSDYLLVDTAGRLHTKQNLMAECEKMYRILEKKSGGRPDEALLVLDACTGQNAVQQARIFSKAAGITGIFLSKLDGSARGGVVFQLVRETGIPVRYLGVGEGIEDVVDFVPEAFVAEIMPD